MALEILGLVAATFILTASWPQLREVMRNGTEGVSLGSWLLFLSASLVWGTYGWKIDSPSTLIGNVAGAVAFSALVVAIVAARVGRARALLFVGTGMAAALVVVIMLPTSVVGGLGIAIGCALALPQLLLSWRSRGLPSTVSVAAWTLVAAGQGMWLLYGLLRPDFAITAVNVVACTASVTVLLLERGRPSMPAENTEPIPVGAR